MTDFERCWTFLQNTQCKTFLWFGECLCLRQWKHLYSWPRITRRIYIPWKYRWESHFKEDVRDIWTVDSVLCLGKVNQNPTSNTVWEEQLSWVKDSSQHRTSDTIDGEPMEFEQVPRIQHIAARRRSPKVHKQNVRPNTIPKTNHLHVDVQWHLVEIWRQWTGMYCKRHTCVSVRKKISSRTLVIPRTWVRNKVVFH